MRVATVTAITPGTVKETRRARSDPGEWRGRLRGRLRGRALRRC